MTLIPGTEFTLGGEKLVIPTISLGQLRSGLLNELKAHDELMSAGKTLDALDHRAKVILAAIRRNYKDFSEEKLLDVLDMSNINDIWYSVLGMRGPPEGEALAAPTERTSGT